MDDSISRRAMQEIVDRIGGMYPYRQIGNRESYSSYNEAWTDCINRVDAELNSLPSAEPERNKGEWVGTEFDGYADGNPVYCEWKCSACGCVVEDEEPAWNYCPNCGADMMG